MDEKSIVSAGQLSSSEAHAFKLKFRVTVGQFSGLTRQI